MTITIKNARLSYRGIVPPEGDEGPIAWSASVRFRWGDLPFSAWVQAIVRHDPQKLLPSPEKMRPLTLVEWATVYTGRYLALMDYETFFPRNFDYDRETIDFSATERRLRPFIPRWGDLYRTPAQDLEEGTESLMRERTPTYRHQVAIVKTPDAATISRLLAQSNIRGVILDFDSPGGEHLAAVIKGMSFDRKLREARENAQLRLYALGAMLGTPYKPAPPPEPEIVSTSSGKRDMSYLAHDRSKNVRKRRRR